MRSRAAIVWERPDAGLALYGFGVAARIQGQRNSPFGDSRAHLEDLLLSAIDAGVDRASRPRAFGGGRFVPQGTKVDPRWNAFGGWEFTVPSLLVAFEGERVSASLTLRQHEVPSEHDIACEIEQLLGQSEGMTSSLAPEPPADPEIWKRVVARVIQEIRSGAYQKAVLARSVDVPTPNLNRGRVLSALAERYPACYIFQYTRGESAWVGASPELLARVEGGSVRAVCLAGSRPRSDDPATDDRFRDELLSSPKEREEHELVRAAIASGIGPFCSSVEHPTVPAVVRMANIQHLKTPFEGKLLPGTTLLDIAASLHPTPAVGGSPRPEALHAIDALEGLDRGWYAGPIGWMDFAGEGEFAVGLRSGLLSPGCARIYAGAGIMADSSPENEYAETETKLRPLRESLAAGLA
ncbi:MAG: isochorismate synthase MenF [Dehalococcoidia bacterium]